MTYVVRECGSAIYAIGTDTVKCMTRRDFENVVNSDPQNKSYLVVALLSTMNETERNVITEYVRPLINAVTVTDTHVSTGCSGVIINIAEVKPHERGYVADVAFVWHRQLPGPHHLAAIGIARKNDWGNCVPAPTYNGVIMCRPDCITVYDIVSERTNEMKSFGNECPYVNIRSIETDPSFMGAVVAIGCNGKHNHRILMNYDDTYTHGRVAAKGKPTRPWLRTRTITAACKDAFKDCTITRTYALAIGDPAACKYIARDCIVTAPMTNTDGTIETRVIHATMQPTYTRVPQYEVGARNGDCAVMDRGDRRRHLVVYELGNTSAALVGHGIEILALRPMVSGRPNEFRVIFDHARKHDQGPMRCEKDRRRKYAFAVAPGIRDTASIELPAYYVSSTCIYVVNHASACVYSRPIVGVDNWFTCTLPANAVRGTSAVTYRGFEIECSNGATFVWMDPDVNTSVMAEFRPIITGKFVLTHHVAH